MERRKAIGWLASALAHAIVLAWLTGEAPPVAQPELSPTEVTLVFLEDERAAPLAREATATRAPTPTARREAEPEALDVPAPTAAPRKRPEPAAPAERSVVDAQPHPAPVVAAPIAPAADAVHASAAPQVARPSSRGPAQRSARPTTARGGPDTIATADRDSYVAQIVRIMQAEIDRDPVAGISPQDTVEVELKVLANGRLGRVADGPYGYADVLRTSLGPVRTRQVLKRIKRASQRFPALPADFGRRQFVVPVKFRFLPR